MATKKGVGLLKLLMHEKPDLAGCAVLCAIGFVGLAVYSQQYDKDTHHMHRFNYTVIREEDANPVAQAKGVYN